MPGEVRRDEVRSGMCVAGLDWLQRAAGRGRGEGGERESGPSGQRRQPAVCTNPWSTVAPVEPVPREVTRSVESRGSAAPPKRRADGAQATLGAPPERRAAVGGWPSARSPSQESERYKAYEKNDKAVKKELANAAMKVMTIKFLNAAPPQPPKSPFAVFVHEKRKASAPPEGERPAKASKREEVVGFTKERPRMDPRSTQDRPRIDPGSTPDRPEIRPRTSQVDPPFELETSLDRAWIGPISICLGSAIGQAYDDPSTTLDRPCSALDRP